MDSAPSQNLILEAIREALEQTTEKPEGAFTTRELCKMTGLGKIRVREALQGLAEVGELEVVRVRAPSISGEIRLSPAYRLKSKE